MESYEEKGQLDNNGLKTGVWEEYYNDGKLAITAIYKAGEKEGECKVNLRNGNMIT